MLTAGEVAQLGEQFARMWGQANATGRRQLVASAATWGAQTDPNPPDYASPFPPRLIFPGWVADPRVPNVDANGEQRNPPAFAAEQERGQSLVDRAGEAVFDVVVQAEAIGRNIVAVPGRVVPYVAIGAALLLLLVVLIRRRGDA